MAFQMGFQHLHVSFIANRKGTKGVINLSWEFKEVKRRISRSLERQPISDIKN